MKASRLSGTVSRASVASLCLSLAGCLLPPPPPLPLPGHGPWPGAPKYEASRSSRVDPRRTASGPGELQLLGRRLGGFAGTGSSCRVLPGRDPGPTCSIRLSSGIIEVNPRAAREIPLNSWAFILGHEFAHQVTGEGARGHTSTSVEARMDRLGADWAVKAGYDPLAFIAWTLSRPDQGSGAHGSAHQRAGRLADHYGFSRDEIFREMQRDGYGAY